MELGETDKITVDLQLTLLTFLPGKDNGRRSVQQTPLGSVAGASWEEGLAALSAGTPWSLTTLVSREGRFVTLSVA